MTSTKDLTAQEKISFSLFVIGLSLILTWYYFWGTIDYTYVGCTSCLQIPMWPLYAGGITMSVGGIWFALEMK